MAAYNRATVDIDGNAFNALSVKVAFNTLKDNAQMPEMGSLTTAITAYVDAHDKENMPFSTLSALFELAKVVTKDKIVPIKITFWDDEAQQDAICSYEFKGWISEMSVGNPMQEEGVGSGTGSTSAYSTVNTLLTLHLEPVLNQQNYGEVTMSN